MFFWLLVQPKPGITVIMENLTSNSFGAEGFPRVGVAEPEMDERVMDRGS
jgi:hypothetical protein